MIAGPGPINLFEFEPIAKERLPRLEYDYIAGGATDEISVRRNRSAFESLALRPRVLRGVSDPDLRTTVLGTSVSFPVLIAPAGGHKKAHPDGESGVHRVLEILREEIEITMAKCGRPTIDSIDSTLVIKAPPLRAD